jgi:D-lyxose ketol-isomerase
VITQRQYRAAFEKACDMLKQAGIVITPAERERFEVADFGLGELDKTGLQLITYVNTDRVCAKELVLFPYQTCPQHRHPGVGCASGKEETFRCRWGTVYLYVGDDPTPDPVCRAPAGSESYYTVWHEICLKPGDQHTIFPDTLHWFQGGPEGTIVSEFSTRSTDEADVFTDIRVQRLPIVEKG